MNLFDLFKREPKGPNPTEIWQADPLVIADATGEIVFARSVEVEVIPLESGKFGMRTLAEGEPSHWLTEAKRFAAPEVGLGSRRGARGGTSYFGKDDAGTESYWYFNHSAESYLRMKQQAKQDNIDESIP